jgi:hypothetical protein
MQVARTLVETTPTVVKVVKEEKATSNHTALPFGQTSR